MSGGAFFGSTGNEEGPRRREDQQTMLRSHLLVYYIRTGSSNHQTLLFPRLLQKISLESGVWIRAAALLLHGATNQCKFTITEQSKNPSLLPVLVSYHTILNHELPSQVRPVEESQLGLPSLCDGQGDVRASAGDHQAGTSCRTRNNQRARSPCTPTAFLTCYY